MPKKVVPHYTQGQVETIDYVYDQLGPEGGLDYCLGNILKYASRAKHKGQLRSDLEKISHYAELALERLPDEQDGEPKATLHASEGEKPWPEVMRDLERKGRRSDCRSNVPKNEH